MSEFTPSKDFTEKVMKEVRAMAHTSQDSATPLLWFTAWNYKPVRYALSGAATFLGGWNFIRLYLAFFNPILCM